MRTYIGVEYKNCLPTGRELTFLADSLASAVQSCLYTLALRGRAKLGPTDRTVQGVDGICIVFAGK